MRTAAMAIPSASDDCCLDFANTRYWRGRDTPAETLPGFAELLDWLERSAGLPSSLVAAVRQLAQPEARFSEVIALREAIYRIFAAASAGDRAVGDDLARFNAALVAAPPRARLSHQKTRYAWTADAAELSTSLLLAPVLWSAADLLTRLDRVRIRRCANDECLWLFLDRSKGGTRRWCDMAACGNRAKSQRHYARTKSAAPHR